MFEITKDFHFSAGHRIDGLDPGHKCGTPHGHNYLVRLFLRSPDLDSVGFVVDFGELSRFKNWIDFRFDHKWLNDVLKDSHGEPFPTTAEVLAVIFYHRANEWFPQVYRVGVRETPKAWAFYTSGEAELSDSAFYTLGGWRIFHFSRMDMNAADFWPDELELSEEGRGEEG